MRENEYQAHLIKRLKRDFPGCTVLKNDSGYAQGIPDLTILFKDKWAVLEVKASRNAAEQPNQSWYVKLLDTMSFAAFIFPENEEEVIHDLQRAFQTNRSTRVS